MNITDQQGNIQEEDKLESVLTNKEVNYQEDKYSCS